MLNRLFFLPVSLAILGLALLVLISIPLARNASRQYEINQEVESLQKEISDLESRNTELNDLIGYLNSSGFAEEQARLNLNFRKEGESVVVVKDPGDDAAAGEPVRAGAQPAASGLAAGTATNPQKWWLYFLQQGGP